MYIGVPSKVPVMSFTFLETPTSVILTELSSESLNVKEEKQGNSMHFYRVSFTFIHVWNLPRGVMATKTAREKIR